MRRPVIVLGVPIDPLDMAGTLNRIEELVRIGRATGKGHQVVTVNADFVVRALFDPELRYLLQQADLATADGMPLVWGARWLGVHLGERVAGADLVPALAQRASEKGLSIYFLGAAPGVAERAAGILKGQNPGFCIAGIQSPPYSSVLNMDTSILEDIHTANPDILLVAFGNPKQEKWIGMYGRELGIPVMIGVGGSLDFIAGSMRRAPQWMQRIGLEWLFRLLQEPGRLWQRYVVDLAVFGLLVVRNWWVMRRGTSAAARAPVFELAFVRNMAILSVSGRITLDDLDSFYECGEQALQHTSHLLANLKSAEFLDSSAIGALLELSRQAHEAGGELSLATVPPAIYNTLVQLGLEKIFPLYDVVDTYLKENGMHENEPAVDHHILGQSSGQSWAVLKTPRIFDAATAPQVKAAGKDALVKNPFLILDLSNTVFLASAGLAALAYLRHHAQELGGDLRIVNCSKEVLRVIKIVRFDRVLSLYNDFSQAVA